MSLVFLSQLISSPSKRISNDVQSIEDSCPKFIRNMHGTSMAVVADTMHTRTYPISTSRASALAQSCTVRRSLAISNRPICQLASRYVYDKVLPSISRTILNAIRLTTARVPYLVCHRTAVFLHDALLSQRPR